MIDNTFQAPPSDPYGATGRVCNWAGSLGLEDIPDEIKTHTKYLILDGIGCAIVGAQLPWSRTATKALLKMEGTGNCTLFGCDQVWPSLRFLICFPHAMKPVYLRRLLTDVRVLVHSVLLS